MEIKDLESKIWFRFLKLVFVFAYIATFLAVLAFAYTSKPYSTNDEYNSKILCDNGKEYVAGDNGINAVDALAEQLGGTTVYPNGFVPDTTEKEKAIGLCLGTPNSFAVGRAPWGWDKTIPPPYKVVLVKKTVGNWWGFIGYTVLALFIVSVIFELIRRSFLYVVIGKRFLK